MNVLDALHLKYKSLLPDSQEQLCLVMKEKISTRSFGKISRLTPSTISINENFKALKS